MKEIPTPLTDALNEKYANETYDDLGGAFNEALDIMHRLEQDRAELIAGLTEALDLVPRISDDDPMAPALAQWCRGAKTVLERMK